MLSEKKTFEVGPTGVIQWFNNHSWKCKASRKQVRNIMCHLKLWDRILLYISIIIFYEKENVLHSCRMRFLYAGFVCQVDQILIESKQHNIFLCPWLLPCFISSLIFCNRVPNGYHITWLLQIQRAHEYKSVSCTFPMQVMLAVTGEVIGGEMLCGYVVNSHTARLDWGRTGNKSCNHIYWSYNGGAVANWFEKQDGTWDRSPPTRLTADS